MVARVRQAADAKQDIRRVAMRIDKIVGQRQVKLQFGMPGRQLRKLGGDVPLTKIDRRIDPHQPAGDLCPIL